jgi:hypothetical protein
MNALDFFIFFNGVSNISNALFDGKGHQSITFAKDGAVSHDGPFEFFGFRGSSRVGMEEE